MKWGKKAEIGAIMLLLLVIGAIYIINHPPQNNVITIQNGISFPKEIKTDSEEIIFINKDNANYTISLNSKIISIQAISRNHYQLTKETYVYISPGNSKINGKITIN